MAKETKEAKTASTVPGSAEDFSRLGWIHLTSHENEAAIEDFRKALSINSALVDANYGLGLALKSLNQDGEALQAFDTATALLDNGAYEEKVRADMFRGLIQVQRILVTTESKIE